MAKYIGKVNYLLMFGVWRYLWGSLHLSFCLLVFIYDKVFLSSGILFDICCINPTLIDASVKKILSLYFCWLTKILVPKMGYIAQRYKFWQFSDNISVGWPRIFFWIAALRPWFEYASFEYKEAYFSDNLNFDLYRAEQHIGGQKT